MRLMFRCGIAERFPTVMLSAASQAMTVSQSGVCVGNTSTNALSKTPKPAAFGATERNAVTGVGAPS